MKFPESYTAKSSTLHIKSLNSGLNLSKNPHENTKEGLAECKNVWFNQGVLQRRPGIQTSTDALLYNPKYRNGYFYYYKTADIEVTIDGEPKKIIVEEIDYDGSVYFCLTHFMDYDGTLRTTVPMRFARVTDEIFYIPDHIVFYKGKSTQGSGVFALVHLVNVENYAETESRIYELDAQFSKWELVTSTYIPTVYINGRGNQYEFAVNTGQVYEGTPIKPEKLNIINDMFYAYYSTDGYSSSFRLPYSNLNPEYIAARLYFSVSEYVEWIITEGETSATAKLYNVTVTMNVNYEKGIVSFSVPTGAYEMPLISDRNQNNLRILAKKTGEYQLDDISVASVAKNINSKILLAANNCVFEADYNRPLYFPSDSVATVGEGDTPLTAIAEAGNSVLLFKKNMTCLLNITRGKAINSISLLAENDAVFYESDKLTLKLLSNEIGCPDKDSVIIDSQQVFWCGADRHIYTLSSSNTVCGVSQNIDSFLDSNFNTDVKTIGVKYGNSFLFVSGNKAIVKQEADGKNPAWYYWEFPNDLLFRGVFYGGQTPYFICTNTGYGYTFISSFQAGVDHLITGSFFDLQLEEHPVQTLIKTVKFPLGCVNALKKVNFIALHLKAKAVSVRLNNRLVADICRHGETDQFETVKLSPGLCPVDTLELELTSDDEWQLGGIDINYTELSLI